MLAIDARGLAKRYEGKFGRRGLDALAGVDLAVPRGAAFGLIGPNGEDHVLDILSGLKAGDSGWEAAHAASDTEGSCFIEGPDCAVSPQAITACPAARMFRAAFTSASAA